jgi:serine/threonine protein kinase
LRYDGLGMTEVSDVELTPGTDVGGYVIERKIGEGGMGIVYAAQQPRIGKRVAVKVLGSTFCRDNEAIKRFEQEARFVNEIRHANIVDVFQHGELPDGRNYLVMELLEGESLSDRIERGPIPVPDAVMILDGVCDALQAAHQAGITHRDIKSDNIYLAMWRDQMRIKLLDFGLAKLAGNDPRQMLKTKTGIVVGTPGYMAPEIAKGKTADGRTDIYALGVLAFKMLTGKLPFDGEPLHQLKHHLLTPAPAASNHAPNIPPPVSQMVQRMMAKEPDQRPTLQEMRGLFAALREGRLTMMPGTAAVRMPPGTAPGARPPLHFVLLALGVVAAGAIAFAIVHAIS